MVSGLGVVVSTTAKRGGGMVLVLWASRRSRFGLVWVAVRGSGPMGLGFLLGLVFVVRGLFFVGCALFGARTLVGGLILLRLRILLVLIGRGLGRGGREFLVFGF